ncbi:hypothetical protein DAPPUDRAFT_252038 [Daphnia pulex]|uniref:Uncharacterized protein n=1 Tax=Daphnia pulex TaxID=6669 RepID=E9H1T1_DAPPU|nr:hypothetical protein DAPPUDRAFT_252038 [Daphnia pulex]|eukprot:EFX74225.1 hypothetical protein DAPPUDRAFT_252038 [Daphnia pulex]
MVSTEFQNEPSLTLQIQISRPRFINWSSHANETSTEPPYYPTTTKSPVDNGENSSVTDSYKMAAQVAVGAAIIVALTILLALIWNAFKRRFPDSSNSGAASSTSRRYSTDSFDRLVEDRLRNRPPPYSPDQDKPPSYEESFHDTTHRHHSPTSRRRSRDRRRLQREAVSSLEVPRVHQITNNRYPAGPSDGGQESTQVMSLPSYSTAIRSVSYDNRAFSAEEPERPASASAMSTVLTTDIPSISMAVYVNERELSLGCQDGDNDDGVVMLHL